MSTEFPPLNDVVQAHLKGCAMCERNSKAKPIPNLGGSKLLCSELLNIYQEYAEYEGKVNNVVARDEFGNEA